MESFNGEDSFRLRCHGGGFIGAEVGNVSRGPEVSTLVRGRGDPLDGAAGIDSQRRGVGQIALVDGRAARKQRMRLRRAAVVRERAEEGRRVR